VQNGYSFVQSVSPDDDDDDDDDEDDDDVASVIILLHLPLFSNKKVCDSHVLYVVKKLYTK